MEHEILRRTFLLLFALAATLLVSQATLAQVRTNHGQAALVAEVKSIAPGQTFDVALYLNPDPGWHIYWINPGDAGLPPKIAWEFPEGFEAGEFQFPAPHFVPFQELMSYGYDGPTFFIAQVTAPEDIEDEVVLAGKARWLACDDQLCVPENATLELKIPKGDGAEFSVWRSDFANTRAQHPIKMDWSASFATMDDRVIFDIKLPEGFPELSNLWLFPAAEKLIDHAAPQTISVSDDHIRFDMAGGVRIDNYDEAIAVMVTGPDDERMQAFELYAERVDSIGPAEFKQSAPVNPGDPFPDSGAAWQVQPPDDSGSGSSSTGESGFVEFLKNLGFAFLGGLILNVMPCVLPILSLKALAVAELTGQDARAARMAGLAYFMGVLVCFALLASAVLALRAGGDLVGWAFHLQNPTIIVLLALLVTAVGLNFSGLFEIRGTFANLGGWTERLTSGGSSEFFTGLLAVIIASPCTVPFMGVALGYALVQPLIVALSVFAGLAVGFALPYLLVTMFPPLRNLLPKPGVWMETMRRILAFPMYATAIWLIWVLGRQTGVNEVAIVLLVVLLLAFTLWCWSQANQSGRTRWRIVSALGAISLVAILVWPQSEPDAQAGSVAEVEWSQATLEQYHYQGDAIFAYFTADWCISCKWNERVALQSNAVQDFFSENDIQVLVGDWTMQGPEIAAELQKHGRAGVPMYLYYEPNGNIDKPVILPAALTPGIVIDYIKGS
ncbi:MAG: protein-disulfide reductase DsbD family protein [Gammaproteobacteria bacterium]|nr:protein-disulfide reductase DsbD family protein [Gammaproteobacteria bacterium]